MCPQLPRASEKEFTGETIQKNAWKAWKAWETFHKRTPQKYHCGKFIYFHGNFPQNIILIGWNVDETHIYIYTITIRCRATLMEQGKETGSRHIQDMVSACLNCWRLGGSMWILDRRFSVASSQVKQLISVQNWAQLGPVKNPEDIYTPNRCPEHLGKLNCWKKVSWSFKLLRSCQNQPTTPRCPRYLGNIWQPNTWRWQKTIAKTVQVTVAGHRGRSSGRRSE